MLLQTEYTMIQQLISNKNVDPLRGKGYKTPLEKIEIDANMKLFLQTRRPYNSYSAS